MTNSVERNNTVVPFWNEIKKLSWEDRSNLAELIELSLQEEKCDDKKMQSFIDNLDETAMKAAADFAYKESLSQKTIPHVVYYIQFANQITIMAVAHEKQSPQTVSSMITRFIEHHTK